MNREARLNYRMTSVLYLDLVAVVQNRSDVIAPRRGFGK